MKLLTEEEKERQREQFFRDLYPPITANGPVGKILFGNGIEPQPKIQDLVPNLPPELIHSWDRHFKGQYRRDYGFLYKRMGERSPKNRNAVLLEIIKGMKQGAPCFATTRYFLPGDYETYLPLYTGADGKIKPDPRYLSMDRVLLDFDNEENPALALADTAKVYDRLSSELDCKPSILFSGSKGCHLLIDADREPVLEMDRNIKKSVLVEFIDRYMEPCKVAFDKGVAHNINTMERIANTRHQKSGLWCIPLRREELDMPLEVVRSLAREPRLEGDLGSRASPIMAKILEEIAEGQKSREDLIRSAKRVMKELGIRSRKQEHRQMLLNPQRLSEHCPGVTSALKGVDTLEHSRRLTGFGLQCFLKHVGDYSDGKLISWNEKNEPPLDKEGLREVLSKNSHDSFCTFLNKAGLCPQTCERLKVLNGK